MLALRRSANKMSLSAPGPNAEQLDELLEIAARVPDHRKLGPWRFIVFEGEARQRFGDKAATIRKANDANAPEKAIEETRNLLMRAPVVVAVISSPVEDGRTPVWEQELSAGALCHNLLLAANASGWAGCWLSEWITFDPAIDEVLGLAEQERVAGYIYLGTSTAMPPERARPDLGPRVSRWQD